MEPPSRTRFSSTIANTQQAFGCYLVDDHAAGAHFTGIVVLTMRGDLVAGITRFLDPGLGKPFDLPKTIDLHAAQQH